MSEHQLKSLISLALPTKPHQNRALPSDRQTLLLGRLQGYMPGSLRGRRRFIDQS